MVLSAHKMSCYAMTWVILSFSLLFCFYCETSSSLWSCVLFLLVRKQPQTGIDPLKDQAQCLFDAVGGTATL